MMQRCRFGCGSLSETASIPSVRLVPPPANENHPYPIRLAKHIEMVEKFLGNIHRATLLGFVGVISQLLATLSETSTHAGLLMSL
jgi:hypothetical protein